MSLNAPRETIPPLKSGTGWAKSSTEKANLFSQTFLEKEQLEPEEINEYTEVERRDDPIMWNGFLPIRVRSVRKLLQALDEKSGTGPDRLGAYLLKRCMEALAYPITLLARIVLNAGRWPLCWRMHWIHPLHKKESKADPTKYRGVHLTAQVSKLVERAIGQTFLPWLHSNKGFGENQYAYTASRSHKDALAANVCSWLLQLELGYLVALFGSDVRGAFDRVRRTRMTQKLRSSGLHPKVVLFLESWIEDRKCVVIVGGQSSRERTLSNSVYQGTVLGPPLWNLFYRDATRATSPHGFEEVAFADDYNCFRSFDSQTPLNEVIAEMEACQSSLHSWGRANSVTFDPTKEGFYILHRRVGCGGNFVLLGVTFDPKLLMDDAIAEIAGEAGWRVRSLLRPMRFFSVPELIGIYKAQVLSYLESKTPAIFHAAPAHQNLLERVQRRFLREIGVTEAEALEDFRLAPLASRRCMAMLGLLHRVTLGIAPAQIANLFPSASVQPVSRIPTRLWIMRHDKQLQERYGHTDVFQRSLFGLVRVQSAPSGNHRSFLGETFPAPLAERIAPSRQCKLERMGIALFRQSLFPCSRGHSSVY